MKTVEEAAVEIYLKNQKLPIRDRIEDCSYIDWFRAGVEFAQQWISVEEEMPVLSEMKEREQFLLKGYFMLENGMCGKEMLMLSRIDIDCWDVLKKVAFDATAGFTTTHWRPIKIT